MAANPSSHVSKLKWKKTLTQTSNQQNGARKKKKSRSVWDPDTLWELPNCQFKDNRIVCRLVALLGQTSWHLERRRGGFVERFYRRWCSGVEIFTGFTGAARLHNHPAANISTQYFAHYTALKGHERRRSPLDSSPYVCKRISRTQQNKILIYHRFNLRGTVSKSNVGHLSILFHRARDADAAVAILKHWRMVQHYNGQQFAYHFMLGILD